MWSWNNFIRIPPINPFLLVNSGLLTVFSLRPCFLTVQNLNVLDPGLRMISSCTLIFSYVWPKYLAAEEHGAIMLLRT